MLIGVAARIVLHPGIFFCLLPQLPHRAHQFPKLTIEQICLERTLYEAYMCCVPQD